MTNQDKKVFLRRYRIAGREIERIENEIKRWESTAEKVTVSYFPAPTTHGDGADRVQSAVDELSRLRGELYARMLALAGLRQKLEAVIASVEEDRLRLLLEYRYIDGLTWEAIAAKMQMDTRWILRLHGRALEKLTIESPY